MNYPKSTVINKKLSRVRANILKNPETFKMSIFTSNGCGCIAGHLKALDEKNALNNSECLTAYKEAERLGVSSEIAGKLFYVWQWPSIYSRGLTLHSEFDKFPPVNRAKLAARRINHFLKTGK